MGSQLSGPVTEQFLQSSYSMMLSVMGLRNLSLTAVMRRDITVVDMRGPELYAQVGQNKHQSEI